jgi:hypothetical protein
MLSHENQLKTALFTAYNVILRFFLRKTKIFQKFIKPTKKFFWPKQKNKCLMILNDKANCQVSRILMNPRPILSDSSENDPFLCLLKKCVLKFTGGLLVFKIFFYPAMLCYKFNTVFMISRSR